MTDINLTTSIKGIAAVRKGVNDIGASFKSMATLAAGALATFGFGSLVKETIDAGDKIQKLSIRIGASTEALSEYKLVAERSGVAFQTLTTGWQRMTRRIAEASTGTGVASGALDKLGLSAQYLATLKPEDQFATIADAMAGVTNQGEKVRLAMQLFDTEGVALLQTMEGGSAAINEVRKQAEAMGLSMSRVEADSMAAFNDAMTDLQSSFRGLIVTLVKEFGPALAEIARWFADVLPKTINFFSGIVDKMRLNMVNNIKGIVDGIKNFLEFASKLPDALGGAKFREWGEDLQFTSDILGEMSKDYEAVTMQTEKFKVATEGADKIQQEANKNLKKAREEHEKNIKVIESVTLKTKRAAQATDSWSRDQEQARQKVDRLSKSLKDYGVGLTEAEKRTVQFKQIAFAVFGNVSDYTETVVVDVNKAWGGFFDDIIREGEGLGASFEEFFGGVKDAILGQLAKIIADQAWNTFWGYITGGSGMSVGGFGGGIGGGIGGAVAQGGLGAGIGAVAANPWTWGVVGGAYVIDQYGAEIEDAVRDFGSSVEDGVRNIGSSIGNVFGWQHGTDSIISTPTLFVAGENGPERVNVTPLNGGSGGSGGPTYVFNGPVIMDEITRTKFERGIISGIAKQSERF